MHVVVVGKVSCHVANVAVVKVTMDIIIITIVVNKIVIVVGNISIRIATIVVVEEVVLLCDLPGVGAPDGFLVDRLQQ